MRSGEQRNNDVNYRVSWLPMTLLLISLLMQVTGTDGYALFRYQRAAILEGEYWRLITGHLIHGTWNHWFLNILGLALVWAIYPRYFSHASALLLCLGIALVTSMTLLVWNPAVMWYVGMSALLHGLFTAWSVLDLLHGRRMALVPLVLVGVKLAYEQMMGPLPASEASAGLPILVDAHLYAALAGMALAGLVSIFGWVSVAGETKKRRSL